MSVNEQEVRGLAEMGCRILGLEIVGEFNGLPMVRLGDVQDTWVPFDPTDLNRAWEVAEGFRQQNPGTAFYLCSERQKHPEWPKLEAYASLSNLNDEDDEGDPGPPSADGPGPKAVALALMRQVQKSALTVSLAHREEGG